MAQGIRSDVAKLHKTVDRVQRQFDGRALAETVDVLAREAQQDAEEAVRRSPIKMAGHSLADLSMSGWHRKKPVKLATRRTPRTEDSAASVLVTPDRTAGLWRVLESGRAGYGTFGTTDDEKAGLRLYERRVTKTMGVRSYKRRVKRNMGPTEAKGTWTLAVKLMGERTRRRGQAKFQRAMGRALRA